MPFHQDVYTISDRLSFCGFGSRSWSISRFIHLRLQSGDSLILLLLLYVLARFLFFLFFLSWFIFSLLCSGTVCIRKAELIFDPFRLFTHFQNNRLVHWNPPMRSVCWGFLTDTVNSRMFTSVCMKVWCILIHCSYYLSLKLSYVWPVGVSASLACKSLRQDCGSPGELPYLVRHDVPGSCFPFPLQVREAPVPFSGKGAWRAESEH